MSLTKTKYATQIINREISTNMEPLCIYAKELSWITGKSERYCRDLLKQIKRHFNKADHQILIVEEVGQYLGLPKEEIIKRIR